MKIKSIKQTVTFASTPEKVYHLIMDQEKHAAFTGSEVIMRKKVNVNSAFLMAIVLDTILN
jgi:uncharacterized protein YndB with AHSA1/START domain